MKTNKRIEKIKLDKLTKKDYEYLYSYAMSEIGEWSKFIILLGENYEPTKANKGTKSVAKSLKGKRLGRKV